MAPADGKTSAARGKTHLKTTDAKRRVFKRVTAQRWRSFRTTTREPLSLLSLNHTFVVLYILWHKAPETGQLSAQAFMHRGKAKRLPPAPFFVSPVERASSRCRISTFLFCSVVIAPHIRLSHCPHVPCSFFHFFHYRLLWSCLALFWFVCLFGWLFFNWHN